MLGLCFTKTGKKIQKMSILQEKQEGGPRFAHKKMLSHNSLGYSWKKGFLAFHISQSTINWMNWYT